MRIRELVPRVSGVLAKLAKLADRLPWRREFALAFPFIGTPLVTGDMEVFALNLVGMVVAALVLRRVLPAKRPARLAAARHGHMGSPLQQGARDDDVSRQRRERHESGGAGGLAYGRPAMGEDSGEGVRLGPRHPRGEADSQEHDLERALAVLASVDTAKATKTEARWAHSEWLDLVRRRFTDCGNGLAAGASPSPRRCLRGSGTRREDYRGP